MDENIKMQFLGFEDGQIACIRGIIYRVYGILIGGEVKCNNETQTLNGIVHRIPLIGKELTPYSLISSDKENEFKVLGEPCKFTMNHINTILSLQKEWGTFKSLIATLLELRDNGVYSRSVLNNENNCIPITVQKGIFYINDIVIGNTNVIYELAALRNITVFSFFEFISDNCENSIEKINIVENALKNIEEHGLYKCNDSTTSDDLYYDGVYVYTNDLVVRENMLFLDFSKKYPLFKKVIKSLMGL